MTDKTPNYTESQEAFIRNFAGTGENGKLNFADATTIANDPAMADAEGNARKPRSIVAKIVRMELPYANKVRQRMDGTAVQSKADLVTEIANLVGVTFEGLSNAPRADLVSLRDALAA